MSKTMKSNRTSARFWSKDDLQKLQNFSQKKYFLRVIRYLNFMITPRDNNNNNNNNNNSSNIVCVCPVLHVMYDTDRQ